jgi:hypothetical protein
MGMVVPKVVRPEEQDWGLRTSLCMFYVSFFPGVMLEVVTVAV